MGRKWKTCSGFSLGDKGKVRLIPIQRHGRRGKKLKDRLDEDEIRFDNTPIILEKRGGSPSGLGLFVAPRELRACQISNSEGGA